LPVAYRPYCLLPIALQPDPILTCAKNLHRMEQDTPWLPGFYFSFTVAFNMRRTAFKMHLKPGFAREYRDRHDKIWPELQKLLSDSGVFDYTIFLDEQTHTLFAVQKNRGDEDSQDLGKSEIVQRWWAYMADIMETNPDNSPKSSSLTEVFHLE
jgi:L-rhamnose mutarotase